MSASYSCSDTICDTLLSWGEIPEVVAWLWRPGTPSLPDLSLSRFPLPLSTPICPSRSHTHAQTHPMCYTHVLPICMTPTLVHTLSYVCSHPLPHSVTHMTHVLIHKPQHTSPSLHMLTHTCILPLHTIRSCMTHAQTALPSQSHPLCSHMHTHTHELAVIHMPSNMWGAQAVEANRWVPQCLLARRPGPGRSFAHL